MNIDELQIEVILVLVAALGIFVGAFLASGLWWRSLNKTRAVLRELQTQKAEGETELAVTRAQVDSLTLAREETASKLMQQEQLLHSTQSDNAGLKAHLEQQQYRYEEQLKTLKDAKEQLSKEFSYIANKIFETKQQQFTQQSRTTLEGTLNPLREQLKDFRRQVEDVYHKEAAERNKLVGQITELQKQTQQIGQDAVNLASALKGSSKTQGNWGEVILERLLEESGLQKGREYETQVSLKDEHGKRRNPDVIVRLPENKDIVIDAKVSLVDYEKYCTSDDDVERKQFLGQHIASMRAHIDGLSKKDYERLESIRSLDFVFIFVPIEAAFMLALQQEPGLFNYAYGKNIVLVSPTTLLATLRTVENIWRYEKQNRNAERIAAMAGGLHDQFALLVDALKDVGQNIEKTEKSYQLVQQRLQHGRGNLLKRVKDLETLGAKTKKSLPKSADDEFEYTALSEERFLGRDKNEELDEVEALEANADEKEPVTSE